MSRSRARGQTKKRRTLVRLIAEQHGLCHYCKTPMFPLHARKARGLIGRFVATIDHKQPTSRGGTDCADNLVAACSACNSRKGKKTEAEFVAKLAGFAETRQCEFTGLRDELLEWMKLAQRTPELSAKDTELVGRIARTIYESGFKSKRAEIATWDLLTSFTKENPDAALLRDAILDGARAVLAGFDVTGC